MAHTIVIFGASGDLTSRKLIPAIYWLHRKGRLPADTRVVGFSRTVFSHEAWREQLARSTAEFVGTAFDAEAWQALSRQIYYHPGDIHQADDFASLAGFLDELEQGQPATRVYYLSTAPQFYEQAVLHLGSAGLAGQAVAPRRVVIEKPFGRDLDSAKGLNQTLHQVFDESQVYRIDHYLGKETVQNLLVLRFANTIFEPIWNRNYIEHVQITAAEAVDIGHRSGYYDTAGVLRDMFQNHLLQLMTLTAMEAPVRYQADEIRDEKAKVLRAVRRPTPEEIRTSTLRAQYRHYRDEEGVAPGSQTATFGAAKLQLNNWRWQGVPFYLRSGKAMSCATTQIVIQFRKPPHSLFDDSERRLQESNRLVIQIQPAEGIQLHFHTKVPDAGMQLRLTDLNFSFRDKFRGGLPEAYQRLLLDILQGDASLFSRSDEVELAWNIIDPIQQAWDADQPRLELYESGGWGPPHAWQWMIDQGREWFDVCPVLTSG